jgi:hypothetical protein
MDHEMAIVHDVKVVVDAAMVLPEHRAVRRDPVKAGLVEVGSIAGRIIERAVWLFQKSQVSP